MAAAASGDLKRSDSYEFLPPAMSELRVVLLGNSWSVRSSVGNLIFGENLWNTEEEPVCCVTDRVQYKNTDLVVINSPDLLHPNISEDKLTEHVEHCVRLSDPGPHVFLLVLQPEVFTEEHRRRLLRVLRLFSDDSLDHSLILISTCREESSEATEDHLQRPPLEDMIRRCRYGYLRQKNLERSELLTRLGQIVKENSGEHVSCDVSEDTTSASPDVPQRAKQKETELAAKAFGLHLKVPALFSQSRKTPVTDTSGFRILLLGKSEDKKTKLQDFIIIDKTKTRQGLTRHGEWRGEPVTVVKTPDVFSLSVQKVRTEMKKCISLFPPGPNVLLLLVKPSDFTEEDRETLTFLLLGLFGEDAFRHSMVVRTQKRKTSALNQLIEDCSGRCYSMISEDHQPLMQKIEKIVAENRGSFLTISEDPLRPKSEPIKAALNLVLCGRRGAGKTSAAEAILGQKQLGSASSSSECVKSQAEVCGRRVSLLELPALCGKPQQEVMEESLRCLSLCDPEGVHAFILVLPVAPLTDEDKGELETIQNTFSSRVNDFTIVLFTMDSDPAAPAVDNFIRETRDVQELLKKCGGRHVVLNLRDKQQIPELLDTVERMRCCYTTETFASAQIEKIIQQEKHITELTKINQLRTRNITCDDEQQRPDSLRIVLIGKTGVGKSSSANTILGRDEFKAKPGQLSVTKYCQKAKSEVNSRPVVVVDTPGLFDTTLSHEEVNREISKCISLLSPGPHVFLLVLKIGRITKEEKETIELVRKVFGKNTEKFTYILLTGGDTLKCDNMSIDEYIKNDCDESFKNLVAECEGRIHVFDNRDKENRTQVEELINKIEQMVDKNGSGCYTNEMFQEAEAAIQKEVQRILKEKEEEMRKEREELQRQHDEEVKAMKERMEEQRAEIEKERKVKEKQLQEKEESIKREREERQKEQKEREEEEKKRKQEEEIQRQEWEKKISALTQQIQKESESKETIDRQLEENREEMRRQREKWEKQQKEMWERRIQEDKQRRQEERTRLEKLEREFKEEKEKYEEERKKEDEIRRERERKEKQELKENYEKQMEEMKKKHEEEAREKAEEFNDFREKKEQEFADMIEEHLREVTDLKHQQEKEMQEKNKEYETLSQLSAHKEQSHRKTVADLQDKHKQEVTDLILQLLTQKKEYSKEVTELKKKHQKEREELEKELSVQHEREEKDQISDLEKKHKQEVEALDKKGKNVQRAKLIKKQKAEITGKKKELGTQQKQHWNEKMRDLLRRQEEEMTGFKQKVLKESEEREKGEIEKLQRKHEEEMNSLKKRLVKAGESPEESQEINELQEKHKAEMTKMKDKLLGIKDSSCSIL